MTMRVLSQKSWNKLFSLPKSESDHQSVNLKLDTFVGDPIAVANAWAKTWVNRYEKITTGVPDRPPTPSRDQLSPGWNRYSGMRWEPSDAPDGTIVFDTETHGSYKQLPILGVAVNKRYWYLWVSPWAMGLPNDSSLVELNSHSLVIAHNASFDVGRVANSYRGDSPDWIDTMSLVQAVNGLTQKIKNTFKGSKKPSWIYSGCGVSLLDAVTFWVTDGSARITEADKSLRDFFKNCKPTDGHRIALWDNWDQLLGYAINDVHATFHLFRVILPEFLKVCPNLTSLMATSLMLRARLPISEEFDDWVNYCDTIFKAKDNQIDQIIDTVVLNTPDDPKDLWLCHLDWYQKKAGQNKGRYNWRLNHQKDRLTMRSRSLPYLLKLQWNDHHLQHSNELGWHLVKDASLVEGYETVKQVKDKNGKITNKRVWQKGYLTGDCIRLPHKLGEDLNVGNPLSDVYREYIEDGTLTSAIPGFDLKAFHLLYFETTYWTGNRDRIHEVFVRNNIHVPSIVPHRTVTRRSGDKLWLTVPDTKEGKIGTAIKSQIRHSKDEPYWLVGADFGTQELMIASLLSDNWGNFELGSNEFSLANFDGSKEKGTDLHSLLAKRFNISRGSVAKPLNFAGLYNCGAKRYATVLKQNAKDVDKPDELARQILQSKRGDKLSALSPTWIYFVTILKMGYLDWALRIGNRIKYDPLLHLGGTDSFYYNAIDARLSVDTPRTPLLDCRMPAWLEKAGKSGDEYMTRANWLIQSTGVDILCLFLVLVDWLKHQKGLHFTYVVSRHDEIWYSCHEDEIDALAEVMQIAHVSVWAALANKLGIHNLPESLALFSEINVDKVLRKEVDLEVWDGYGEKPDNGYYIKSTRFIEG